MILAVTLVFVIGYLMIIFEHALRIDKAVSALLAGISCWTIIALNQMSVEASEHIGEDLAHAFSEISSILFFLMGAMTIVELIDLHDGFQVIQHWIKTRKKIVLLIMVSAITFFLSAVLDNLTTTIVMISILRKLVHHNEDRLWFVSIVVIAANAGGAWSPIGDVTTTMLWNNDRVSSLHLVQHLFIPSLLNILIPLLYILFSGRLNGQFAASPTSQENLHVSAKFYFWIGIMLLLSVPLFKAYTHLPPFMAMMAALALLWLISEIDHPFKFPATKESPKPTVRKALSRIEIPSILFFFGILLAISALEKIGQLEQLGAALEQYIGHPEFIALTLGILSAVIDNVPLVAGAMGMYDLPLDHVFWHQIAYAAGTGGSILIIGSAAGVVAMGIENISYPWYLKKISLLALLGYLAGWIYMYFYF